MSNRKSDYGTLLTNAGKVFQKYGKEFKKIGAVVSDNKLSVDDKIAYMKKRNNYILSKAKKDYNDYMNKRDKAIGYIPEFSQNPDSIGKQVESRFESIIKQCEEIKELESSSIEDYKRIVEKYS